MQKHYSFRCHLKLNRLYFPRNAIAKTKMTDHCHYIAGTWKEGIGESFSSINPATGNILWSGYHATQDEVEEAILAARESSNSWSALSLNQRLEYVRVFEDRLKQGDLAETISQETGKPFWESKQEVATMIQKINVSLEAYKERCPDKELSLGTSTLNVRHKPHGVTAVLVDLIFQVTCLMGI